jgi:hypothetical protein
MRRKPKDFFHPIDGSAALSIYWYPVPHGEAIESKEGNGVHFASPNGEFLGVQFDDISEDRDQQSLTTKVGHRVSIVVKGGKVTIKLENSRHRVA